MSKYTLVQGNKLYYVDNGKAITLEEHYRNEIERYGNQLLEEVNGRHHVHEPERTTLRASAADEEHWLWHEPGPGFATGWRRSSDVERKGSEVDWDEVERKTNSCFWWLLAGAVLAGLLVWWW